MTLKCYDTEMFGEIYIPILVVINELTTASVLQIGRLCYHDPIIKDKP